LPSQLPALSRQTQKKAQSSRVKKAKLETAQLLIKQLGYRDIEENEL